MYTEKVENHIMPVESHTRTTGSQPSVPIMYFSQVFSCPHINHKHFYTFQNLGPATDLELLRERANIGPPHLPAIILSLLA
jgi:hypothetical protein